MGIATAFAPTIDKLNSDQSVVIYTIGDSTCYGQNDGGRPYWRGWPGRIAVMLAQQYDANVRVYDWNPNAHTYVGPYNLYTLTNTSSPWVASSPSRPMVTLMQGGWPGAIISTYIASAAAMLPHPDADIVFVHDGFNERSPASFVADYFSFIDIIKTRCPGAPIMATTETWTVIPNQVGLPLFDSLFAAMVDAFLPGFAIPIDPVIKESPVKDGVWVIDTHQVPLVSSDFAQGGGLHPSAIGYTKIATWMYDALTDGIDPLPEGILPIILTTTLDIIATDIIFSEQIVASGDGTKTWEIHAGALPAGLTLSSGGVISGTPTGFGSYDFTVRVINNTGFDDQQFTGVIAGPTQSPFVPAGSVKAKIRLNDLYYPLVMKIRES